MYLRIPGIMLIQSIIICGVDLKGTEINSNKHTKVQLYIFVQILAKF